MLKKIADFWLSNRQSDIFARYGVDEFAINLKIPTYMRKIVNQKIQDVMPTHSIADRPLTVSVGEAQLTGDQTPENMLEEADKDLYKDKAIKKVQR